MPIGKRWRSAWTALLVRLAESFVLYFGHQDEPHAVNFDALRSDHGFTLRGHAVHDIIMTCWGDWLSLSLAAILPVFRQA